MRDDLGMVDRGEDAEPSRALMMTTTFGGSGRPQASASAPSATTGTMAVHDQKGERTRGDWLMPIERPMVATAYIS